MSDPENIRRDISKLSSDLSKGVGATSILIEQMQRHLTELGRKVEDKTTRDHARDLEIAGLLSTIKTKLEALDDIPDRLAKLEGSHEHVKADVTGKHSTVTAEEKKAERDLEKKRIRQVERSAKLQFWAAIVAVAMPGLLSLIWQLFGIPGEPPRLPAERPASHQEHERETPRD